jgi:membrane protease YdiL (CAAX protease family)
MQIRTEPTAPVRASVPLSKTLLFLAGFLILFLVYRTLLLLSATIDWTITMLLVCGLVIIGSVLARKWITGETWAQATRQVGLGRPRWGAVWISLLGSVLLLSFFPLYSTITGTALSLKSNWFWILLGMVAGVGVSEETLFRGYAFHYLNERWSFWRAATISMVLFALMHLLLLFWMPFVLAVAAILLSIIAAYPMAYLFNKCNHTIWAGVLLHSIALATNLFVIPEAVSASLSLVWIVAVLVGMLLVVVLTFVFLRDPK